MATNFPSMSICPMPAALIRRLSLAEGPSSGLQRKSVQNTLAGWFVFSSFISCVLLLSLRASHFVLAKVSKNAWFGRWHRAGALNKGRAGALCRIVRASGLLAAKIMHPFETYGKITVFRFPVRYPDYLETYLVYGILAVNFSRSNPCVNLSGNSCGILAESRFLYFAGMLYFCRLLSFPAWAKREVSP